MRNALPARLGREPHDIADIDEMRNASPPPVRTGVTCVSCGAFRVIAVQGLFSNPKVGSPQRFCSPACRQAAWRRRRVGVAEDAPRQITGGRSRSLRAGSDAEPP
jgi:hypothetical protein